MDKLLQYPSLKNIDAIFGEAKTGNSVAIFGFTRIASAILTATKILIM